MDAQIHPGRLQCPTSQKYALHPENKNDTNTQSRQINANQADKRVL